MHLSQLAAKAEGEAPQDAPPIPPSLRDGDFLLALEGDSVFNLVSCAIDPEGTAFGSIPINLSLLESGV